MMIRSRQEGSGRLRRAAIRLSVAALTAAIAAAVPAFAQWPEEDSGTFDAYWALSGTVHILELPDGALAAAGGLTGTVTVQTSQGPIPSFETECVFFSDGSGGEGRCVWTGTSGDQILVGLKSDGPAGMGRVRGELTGGTGRFEGISGRFEFEWNYQVSGGKDASLDGNTLTMRGRYRLPRR